MKALKLITINLFILVGIAMFSNAAWATCSFRVGHFTYNNTMPILKTQLTVGRDVPVGTVIYRQVFNTTRISQINCNGTGQLTTKRHITNNSKIKANWTGSPFPNAVYESGIPGIGFAYGWRSNSLPIEGTLSYNNQIFEYTNALDFEINFIKIGPVTPGSINLASFPTATLDAIFSTGYLNISNVNFSGSMQIVSKTCTTPDVIVDMGSNSLEPLVAGTQTNTPEKSFNVVLRDCPVFYGMGLTDFLHTPTWDPALGTTRYYDTPNTLGISFTPKNGVLDSDAMIAKLDPVQPNNAPAAQGIGIALHFAYNNRVKFDGSFIGSGPFNMGVTGDKTIPFRASYTYDATKPKSVMKPGSASTAIEFTLQYN